MKIFFIFEHMRVLSILLLSCITSICFSQSIQPKVINANGGSFKNNGVYLQSNVGEAITRRIANTNNFISQGFLQPKQKRKQIQKKEEDINEFSIYPNPTKDFINIKTPVNSELYWVKIFNSNGKLLLYKNLGLSNQISFINYQRGIYYLLILDKDNNILKKVNISRTY